MLRAYSKKSGNDSKKLEESSPMTVLLDGGSVKCEIVRNEAGKIPR